jgi:hypothetical protein
MGQRQRDWARRTREKLFDLLGRKCAWCGLADGAPDEHGRAVKLTFDCIQPTGDGVRGHHKQEWSWRLSFYRAQLADDNLQVLCDGCNSKKGETVMRFDAEPEMDWSQLGEFEPF